MSFRVHDVALVAALVVGAAIPASAQEGGILDLVDCYPSRDALVLREHAPELTDAAVVPTPVRLEWGWALLRVISSGSDDRPGLPYEPPTEEQLVPGASELLPPQPSRGPLRGDSPGWRWINEHLGQPPAIPALLAQLAPRRPADALLVAVPAAAPAAALDPRDLAPAGDDEDPARRPGVLGPVAETAATERSPLGADVPGYFLPPPADDPLWVRFEVSQPDPLDPRNYRNRRRPTDR